MLFLLGQIYYFSIWLCLSYFEHPDLLSLYFTSENDLSQQVEHMQVLNWTGLDLRSKHPLSICHTHRKCSLEMSRQSVKRSSSVIRSRLGLKSDQELVVISYGHATECHLTFVRGELHIV